MGMSVDMRRVCGACWRRVWRVCGWKGWSYISACYRICMGDHCSRLGRSVSEQGRLIGVLAFFFFGINSFFFFTDQLQTSMITYSSLGSSVYMLAVLL